MIKVTVTEVKVISDFKIAWDEKDKLWVSKGFDMGWPILKDGNEIRGYGRTPEESLKDLMKELTLCN